MLSHLPVSLEEALKLLGLASASDPKAVRRAYMRAVKAHPPERDPQGFQRVRAAYEQIEAHIQRGDQTVANTQSADVPLASARDDESRADEEDDNQGQYCVAPKPPKPPFRESQNDELTRDNARIAELEARFSEAANEELSRVSERLDPDVYRAIAHALDCGMPELADVGIDLRKRQQPNAILVAREVLRADAPTLFALYEHVLFVEPPSYAYWQRGTDTSTYSVNTARWAARFMWIVVAITVVKVGQVVFDVFTRSAEQTKIALPPYYLRLYELAGEPLVVRCKPEDAPLCIAAQRLNVNADCQQRDALTNQLLTAYAQAQTQARVDDDDARVVLRIHKHAAQRCGAQEDPR